MINMSTKSEDNNQNGWEIDDNEWDDWGDAEDNFTEEFQTFSDDNKPTTENKPTNPESNSNAPKSNNFKTDNENITNETLQTEPQTQNKASGWGSLFGGVVSSVLSTATELTTTVSHGLDKVIGVPDPAEMARINMLEEVKSRENSQLAVEEETSLASTNSTQSFGLGLVNNVTSLGSKVINTGLDTLEGIGKKTMNILQENDPMLKNKIKKLGLEQDVPNISEILKEAKYENEQLEQSLKELSLEKSNAQLRFEVLFESNCGLVHLEALEILSKESQLKIQSLKESVSGKALEDLRETLNEVKELMEIEDLESEPDVENYDKDELDGIFQKAIEDVDLQIQFKEITSLWSDNTEWLISDEAKSSDCRTVFVKGINSLAETCAYEILKLHKIAELLLIKDHHSTANEVDGICQLCKQFSMHLQIVANQFAANLSTHAEQNEAKSYISTIFAEMLQARKQIEKAFNLFIPILQIGAV